VGLRGNTVQAVLEMIQGVEVQEADRKEQLE
jgi:hypothetical protein